MEHKHYDFLEQRIDLFAHEFQLGIRIIIESLTDNK